MPTDLKVLPEYQKEKKCFVSQSRAAAKQKIPSGWRKIFLGGFFEQQQRNIMQIVPLTVKRHGKCAEEL